LLLADHVGYGALDILGILSVQVVADGDNKHGALVRFAHAGSP
jgi:hypothetical protein